MGLVWLHNNCSVGSCLCNHLDGDLGPIVLPTPQQYLQILLQKLDIVFHLLEGIFLDDWK